MIGVYEDRQDRRDTGIDAVGYGRTNSSGNDAESEEEVGSNGYDEPDTRARSGRYDNSIMHYREDADNPMIQFEGDPQVGNNRQGDCHGNGNGFSMRRPNGNGNLSRNNSFWRMGSSRGSDLSEPLLGGEGPVPSERDMFAAIWFKVVEHSTNCIRQPRFRSIISPKDVREGIPDANSPKG
ncbi:hypothetical protein CBR_g66763 [Chara braunii]|uniref:Uncharacterized protein n=1 Tax=Chara braunii TaxID=69332 RepID=A0A388K9B9_CHABU|nr:hypothetical protein CBR_g66763 [Chara braunii]|eukprot:GBG66627.1 hypothetical protein CBR_g66763 [Chara braunii]